MASLSEAERIYPQLVELRRGLHQIPEPAFEEVRTAEFVMAELRRLGIPFEYGGKGGGVVARLAAGAGGRTVALRAEMDALPGSETTGLPFVSTHPGFVHACGHDAHMAMVLGAAALLATNPPRGTVVFLFQPAEERGMGSRRLIEAGALAGVEAIFAGHVTHHYQTGEIMVTEGVVTAQSDRFVINVSGKSGHGARPHEAVDAVVIAGFLVSAIQTLVSRETNPVHPAVVTVGRLEAGTAANVIAGEARLEGSIRTTLPEVRRHIHEGLRRMAAAAATLHNARVDIEIAPGNPPVVNSPREAQIARRAAGAVVGATRVVPQDHPSLGSEDFAWYLKEIPGCYVRFGARRPDWEYVPLHSPAFDVDEESLKIGAAFLDEVARETLRAPGSGP